MRLERVGKGKVGCVRWGGGGGSKEGVEEAVEENEKGGGDIFLSFSSKYTSQHALGRKKKIIKIVFE